MDQYTLIEIIEMYEKFIGNNLEGFLYNLFNMKQENINRIRKKAEQLISEDISEIPIIKNNNSEEIRSAVICNAIKQQASQDVIINNNEEIKLTALLLIYKNFSKNMTKKDIKKIKKLMLGDKSYFGFEILNGKVAKSYEIITSEDEEKIKSIYNDNTRECIRYCLEQAIYMGDIRYLLKDEYGSVVYNLIENKIYSEILLENNKMTVEEFNKHLEEGFKKISSKDEKIREEFEERQIDYFSNNLQLLNKERLLLSSAARTILGLRIFKGEEIKDIVLNKEAEEVIYDETLTKNSIEYLKMLHRELKKMRCKDNEVFRLFTDDEEEIIAVNMEYLDEFLSKCTKDDYISPEEIDKMHKDIEEGHLVEDEQKRIIANIDIKDLINLSNRYELKKANNEAFTVTEKEKFLETAKDLANYLIQNKLITEEELLNLYIKGDLSSDLIKKIDIDMPEAENYFYNKFKQLYINMVYHNDDEKGMNELKRFSSIYRYIEKTGKVDIDRKGIIDELTTLFGKDFNCQILGDLYELEIIDIKKCIELAGVDALFEQYNKGIFRPIEVKKLYESGFISLDDIGTLIKKISDNGEKLTVIGSIFPDFSNEHKSIREILIEECLIVEEDEQRKNSGTKSRIPREDKKQGEYRNIIDPFAKQALFQSLDESHSIKMTENGWYIVALPKLEKVIIEKMLEKDRTPAYGHATYVLDKDYYIANKSAILYGNKIDKPSLVSKKEEDGIEQVTHHGDWGEKIKKALEIESKSSKYTEEELEKIDNAIERVKTSTIREKI